MFLGRAFFCYFLITTTCWNKGFALLSQLLTRLIYINVFQLFRMIEELATNSMGFPLPKFKYSWAFNFRAFSKKVLFLESQFQSFRSYCFSAATVLYINLVRPKVVRIIMPYAAVFASSGPKMLLVQDFTVRFTEIWLAHNEYWFLQKCSFSSMLGATA